MKRVHTLFLAVFLIASQIQSAFAAPKRYDYAAEANTALKEMRDTIDDMRHEANNRDSEMRVLDEKFSTHQAALDSLRQQFQDGIQANKESVKDAIANLEAKISSLEIASKGLVADLKQLKTHANDSGSVLEQVEARFAKIEKMVEVQNKNLTNLETAMSSMMDAIQIKETPKERVSSKAVAMKGITYKVKSGDSLEKIAKAHGTTIKILKELNNLSSDKIIVGQSLEIPE